MKEGQDQKQHGRDSKDLSHGSRQTASRSHSLEGVAKLHVFSHQF